MISDLPHPSKQFVERLGLVVGWALVLNMTFMTVAPYVLEISPTAARLIDQQQTILQAVFMVLVGYLWGNSSGNQTMASALSQQADTIKSAQAALNPSTVPDVVVPAGESPNMKAGDGSDAAQG